MNLNIISLPQTNKQTVAATAKSPIPMPNSLAAVAVAGAIFSHHRCFLQSLMVFFGFFFVWRTTSLQLLYARKRSALKNQFGSFQGICTKVDYWVLLGTPLLGAVDFVLSLSLSKCSCFLFF
jgi:membrane-bound metal-dependent hydrolase YbcI (DUF457 family)